MPYCYNCGDKLYLLDKTGEIDYAICDKCGHELTVHDYGHLIL